MKNLLFRTAATLSIFSLSLFNAKPGLTETVYGSNSTRPDSLKVTFYQLGISNSDFTKVFSVLDSESGQEVDISNQNSVYEFSFLSKKDEPNKSLFAKEQYLDASAPYLKRLRKREEDNVNLGYLGDTYLGDVNTTSNKAIIVCRDFEYEDGDRVQILLNDEILLQDLYLKNQYFVMTIDLKPGFNKFDFKALNQGSSGPNTAELRVFDEDQKLLSSNQWNLSTGATATFIVVKEM